MKTNFIKRTVISGAVTLAVMSASLVANAAPSFIGYPAPGDEWFSFSGSGSPGHIGGGTWSFTGMDLTGYDELYYGLNPAFPTQLRLDNPDPPGPPIGPNLFLPHNTMTIASVMILGGGVSTASWEGSSEIVDAISGTTHTVTTRFTATVTDLEGAGTGFVLSGDVGIPYDPAVAAVVEVLGDFTYHRVVEFDVPSGPGFPFAPGSSVPYLYGFDLTATPEDDRTAFSQGHGFYAALSEDVPAPGALLLLSFGLLGMGIARRKAA